MPSEPQTVSCYLLSLHVLCAYSQTSKCINTLNLQNQPIPFGVRGRVHPEQATIPSYWPFHVFGLWADTGVPAQTWTNMQTPCGNSSGQREFEPGTSTCHALAKWWHLASCWQTRRPLQVLTWHLYKMWPCCVPFWGHSTFPLQELGGYFTGLGPLVHIFTAGTSPAIYSNFYGA